MALKRAEVYKSFKKYVQEKDKRPMDKICSTPNNEFKLQAQQRFLKEYMHTYPDWQSMLLYHEIGSGKTCTAITMAEEFMAMNNKAKAKATVRVILPARLRTNFLDELISPCGMEHYITSDDYARFNSNSTPVSQKRAIQRKFMSAINAHYDIMSFEKFRRLAMQNKADIATWIKEWTKGALIVIDEVHNLVTDKYNVEKATAVINKGAVIEKSFTGLGSVLLKLLTKHAHPSAKFVFMTATPIFDNIAQFKELVQVMNPHLHMASLENATLGNVIDHLRGKVSYFPGTSINAYPNVKFETHSVPLTTAQDDATHDVLLALADEMDDNKEAFMSKQRQISIAVLPGGEKISENVGKVIKNMNEYCPKVKKLVENITKQPGKHIVFSNFVQSGLRVVQGALHKAGWKNLLEVKDDKAAWAKHKGKVYALWDGSAKDDQKLLIKAVANDKANIFGEKVRVILGSPSIKEGVSFKHIQHIHLLDPVWNQSAKTQVEGRAIRFCSHVDIDEKKHKPLKRTVVVNVYKSVPRKDGLVQTTCDETIYDVIIPKKNKLVQMGQNALKRVAIDHYLFRKMYKEPTASGFTSPHLMSAQSDLGLDTDQVNLRLKQIKATNTCPKKRRPFKTFRNDSEWMCLDPNSEVRENPHGDLCCYKNGITNKSGESKPSRCPKDRRPDGAGKCPPGQVSRPNKRGEPCCYKR